MTKIKAIQDFISQTSPLYDYWCSAQDANDEKKRLLKSNTKSPAAYLFQEEPYKWENLYQCIAREVLKGDLSSIKGMKILLGSITFEERERLLKRFSERDLFDQDTINLFRAEENLPVVPRKNRFRFFRVLLSIFFNPYNIEIKGRKKHLYEYTGHLVLTLRKPFS